MVKEIFFWLLWVSLKNVLLLDLCRDQWPFSSSRRALSQDSFVHSCDSWNSWHNVVLLPTWTECHISCSTSPFRVSRRPILVMTLCSSYIRHSLIWHLIMVCSWTWDSEDVDLPICHCTQCSTVLFLTFHFYSLRTSWPLQLIQDKFTPLGFNPKVLPHHLIPITGFLPPDLKSSAYL